MEMKVKWYWSNHVRQWQEEKTYGSSNADSQLVLDGTAYQKMVGFGGCFNERGYESLNSLSENKQKQLLEELFCEEKCNFSICRLPIGGNDYSFDWYSLDDVKDDYRLDHFSIERDKKCLIPFVSSALEYNENIVLMASPWSPPVWMKDPQIYNGGKLHKDKRTQSVYADYLARFLKEYRKEGIHIHQLHVQNEPVANQKFPSCLWTGEELKVFIRDFLGPRLEKEKIDTEIWLGTINAPGCDYKKLIFDKWADEDYDYFANMVLSDKKAAKYVSGVSYQWGGKIAIQRTFESWWPEYRLMQTENECGFGDNTWEYALYNWTMIKHYISNGAESYLYWNMMLPKGGYSTWLDPQNCLVTIDNGNIIYNPDFYLMKHFSSIVKKGSVRLGLKGHFAGDSLIFRNSDGSYAVEMMNPFDRKWNVSVKINDNEFVFQLEPRSINSILIAEE